MGGHNERGENRENPEKQKDLKAKDTEVLKGMIPTVVMAATVVMTATAVISIIDIKAIPKL